ncbi:MAG: thymidylate kinase [Ruminococcaceae bacterium]|nr:thymidylate kinase [Oscillospiraceae bacterium]
MGKLIVIEGVDASGKATQTERLYNRLAAEGKNVRKISFPDYNSDFSVPIKRYLAGDLGKHADDVGPYAASLFYAIDRYAGYKRDWGSFYEDGGILIADRYVTSNLVHQAAKIKGDKTEFMHWLHDLEYEKLALPRPDLVFFLDMPPACARRLMETRANKITGEAQKDIHESDAGYLERSYENAMEIARLADWQIIHCAKGETVRSIDEIHEEMMQILKMKIEHS